MLLPSAQAAAVRCSYSVAVAALQLQRCSYSVAVKAEWHLLRYTAVSTAQLLKGHRGYRYPGITAPLCELCLNGRSTV